MSGSFALQMTFFGHCFLVIALRLLTIFNSSAPEGLYP
jgi:hypothetical protein